MRVLLDESLPRELARELEGHEVRTVRQHEWAGWKNGDLLRAAVSAGFDVLLTADRNLEHQQNLPAFALAVVVVRAPSNRLQDLIPLVSRILHAIGVTRPGEVSHASG